MTFINTRPVNRAAALSQSLHESNVPCVEIPMLHITSVDIMDRDVECLHALYQGKYDVLVVVSPTAAEYAQRWLTEFNQYQSTNTLDALVDIVVVGQATAQTLSGLSVNIPEQASNEGMLQLTCIAELDKMNRVMIWRGEGGRRLLVDDLLERGVTVDIIEWYRREFPKQSIHEYQKFVNDRSMDWQACEYPPTVLISSADAFANWQRLLVEAMQLTVSRYGLADFRYIVLGQRLVQILSQYGLQYNQVDDLSAQTLMKAYRLRFNDIVD